MNKVEFAFYQIHVLSMRKNDIISSKEKYTCFAILNWFGITIISWFLHFVNISTKIYYFIGVLFQKSSSNTS